jgi:hypothetical protein
MQDPGLARDLLRAGAFSALRESIRALGEYAVLNGAEKDGSPLANNFFVDLQEYDRVLSLEARRVAESSDSADTESTRKNDDATGKLTAALKSMDALLATVPEDVMQGARALLDAAADRAKARAKAEAEVKSGVRQAPKVELPEDKLLEKMLQ